MVRLRVGAGSNVEHAYSRSCEKKTLWRTFSGLFKIRLITRLVITRKQLLIDEHVLQQLTPNAIMIVLDSQKH